MKICMVPAYTLGAYKKAIELKKLGHTVIGVSHVLTQFEDAYDKFYMIPCSHEMLEVLNDEDSDVVIIFHELAGIAPFIENMRKTIVCEIGALELLRIGKMPEKEVSILQCADGIMYNSECFKESVQNSGIEVTANDAVTYLYANESLFQYPTNSRGGILCQGSFASPLREERFTQREYRNMFPVADAFDSMKTHFDIRISEFFLEDLEDYIERYKESKYISVLNPIPYGELIKEIGKYHWGFIGTPIENSYMDFLMPHRLFDCIAAGIPIMVMNMKKTSEFVEKEGIGITIKSYEDVGKYYHLWKDKQKTLLENRSKWTMGNHIHETIRVLEKAIEERNE